MLMEWFLLIAFSRPDQLPEPDPDPKPKDSDHDGSVYVSSAKNLPLPKVLKGRKKVCEIIALNDSLGVN
jgi:hypothetical protein